MLLWLEKQRMSIQYGGVWFELPDSRWSHALCRWVQAIWPRKGCNAMVMVLLKNNRILSTRVYIPLASYVNWVELGHLLSGICTQSTASCNWSIDMLRITTIMCFFLCATAPAGYLFIAYLFCKCCLHNLSWFMVHVFVCTLLGNVCICFSILFLLYVCCICLCM